MKKKNGIIYEDIVKYDKNKFDTRITIKDNIIILEKKKGLFKREYRIIDLISIDDIKVDKNKIYVNYSGDIVELKTINKNYHFICKDSVLAKRLVDEINKFKLVPSFFEKFKINSSNLGERLVKTAEIVGSVVATTGIIANAISKNKDAILDAAEIVRDIIKQ